MRLVPLDEADAAAREQLLDRAFGPDRLLRTAARVRAGAAPLAGACLAVLDGAALVGSIAVHRIHWHAADGRMQPLAWLGPLARDPDREGEGIGVALMHAALAAVDAAALDVALIGDAPYYQRWGFSAEGTALWAMPGPVDRARLLLRARAPDGWVGPAILRADPALLPSA